MIGRKNLALKKLSTYNRVECLSAAKKDNFCALFSPSSVYLFFENSKTPTNSLCTLPSITIIYLEGERERNRERKRENGRERETKFPLQFLKISSKFFLLHFYLRNTRMTKAFSTMCLRKKYTTKCMYVCVFLCCMLKRTRIHLCDARVILSTN